MLVSLFTGVQFYIVILIAFTVLFWIIPQRFQWASFVVAVLLFTYMAYMIVPDSTDDLSHYFYFIDDFRKNGYENFKWHIEENHFDWKIYRASAYFFYFISKLPNNHFLPALTIFVAYGSSCLVLNDASVRFDVDRFHTYIGSMFFFATYWFFDTASGIRNGFAFSLAFAASYFHIVVRKYIPICIIGYLIAAFFHSAGIMPVIIVAITIITLRVPGKFINVLLIFGIIGGASLVNYLATKTDNGFIQTAAQKSEHYSENYELGKGLINDTATMFKVNVVLTVIVALILFYVVEYFKKSNYPEEMFRLEKLTSSTLYFMIGAVAVGLIFVRFARWILPVLGGVIFMTGMQFQKNEIDSKGVADTMYFAEPIERVKYKARPVVITLFVIFTLVHIWYQCNGSSLIWTHFEHEWLDAGFGDDFLW